LTVLWLLTIVDVRTKTEWLLQSKSKVSFVLRKFTFAKSGWSVFELWLNPRPGLEPENMSSKMTRYF
jgi:hypothetical protein